MCSVSGMRMLFGMTAMKASVLILVAVAGFFGARVVAAPEHSVDAVELFVSPGGRDSWPGTKIRPFATLERAQRAVRARTAGMSSDVVVNVRGGTYRLRRPLRLSAEAGDSGDNGHRVIYQAYGYGTGARERVVISGGRRVSGWRRAENVDGAWRADVGNLETRQLFVAGRRAQRTALGRGLPSKAIRVRTGYATRSTVPQSWRHPEDIELVFNGGQGALAYSEARCGVSRIRGDAKWSLITVDQPCWSNLQKEYRAEVPGARPAAPTDVENSLSLLREPGSWYLDRSRRGRHVLYYLPRRREDPRRVQVVAPVLERLVVGAGTRDAPLHDVAVRGLTFSHATWLAPNAPTGFPQIIGSWIYAGGKGAHRMPGQVAFRAAERISIEGNHFIHLGGLALVLSRAGPDNAVRGNVVEDVSGGGVEVRGPGGGSRVEDNWVHHIGVDYRGSVGISLEGSRDATVAHNQVNAVPYTGIWGQSPAGLQVEGNLVFNAVRTVPDGGGIYLPSAQGTSFRDGALVRGNVVHHAGDTGIYPDVGADWVTLERNVLYGSKDAVSGVEPRRIRIAGNYWDDDKPFWWPKDTPTEEVTLVGNALLPRAHPAASCRADAACADIAASAGRRMHGASGPLATAPRRIGAASAYD
jgi:Right handed beta helix region